MLNNTIKDKILKLAIDESMLISTPTYSKLKTFIKELEEKKVYFLVTKISKSKVELLRTPF